MYNQIILLWMPKIIFFNSSLSIMWFRFLSYFSMNSVTYFTLVFGLPTLA